MNWIQIYTKDGFMPVMAFDTVADKRSTEALQFYEDNADYFDKDIFGTAPIDRMTDIGNKGWNMDELRSVCKMYGRYSHARFMEYVAARFETTVAEMKTQWRNIKVHE